MQAAGGNTLMLRKTSTWNAAVAVVLFVAAGLLLSNLSSWPATWYDEGLPLQAAKNLARDGRYGLQSGQEFRAFDPLLSVGPTVTLPIALSFKVFGIGLVEARAVMVAYALLTLLACVMLCRHVFDARTAVVAAWWLLALPTNPIDDSASFLALGRMALGEVPSLLFTVTGAFVWFLALDRGSTRLLVTAGLLVGLAVVTKSQAVLVVAALVGVWLVDALWHRQLRRRDVALPVAAALGCMLVWHLVMRYGPGSSYAEVGGVGARVLSHALSALWSPRAMARNLGALSASGLLTWGIPALVYGVYLCKERSLMGVKRSFLLIISVIWFTWFVLGSIGWLRYAFLGAGLTSVFTAKLLTDLAGGFNVWRRRGSEAGPAPIGNLDARNAAVTLALILMIALPLAKQWRAIPSPDASMSWRPEHVDRMFPLPQQAVIETLEAEVVFLSEHTFTQPPLGSVMEALARVVLGKDSPPAVYRPDSRASHLLIGRMARETGLYAPYLDRGCCTLLYRAGTYEMYEVTRPASFR